MQDQESVRLLARYRDGDQDAADEIFRRYIVRLTALADARLSEKMKVREAPEDVVQSALGTFFRNAKEGRYSLERGGDLWRLLAAITVHKVLKKVEFHQAQKRDVECDQGANHSSWDIKPEAISHDPSPEEAITIADELEQLMRQLKPKHQEILQLRLQGASLDEISRRLGRTTRTVQRVVKNIGEQLETQLLDLDQTNSNNKG